MKLMVKERACHENDCSSTTKIIGGKLSHLPVAYRGSEHLPDVEETKVVASGNSTFRANCPVRKLQGRITIG